jgi:retron-type reverse transcriptase
MGPGNAQPANEVQGSNPRKCDTSGTTGLPKGRKAHGNRSVIVSERVPKESPEREGQKEGKNSYKADSINSKECGKLTTLYERNKVDETYINENLIHVVGDIEILTLAYEQIKSNKGNMTPGVTPETLDGISKAYLERVASSIKAGKYQFSPARRIHIPKPGKSEKRPLVFDASPREKIVQKAIELVLTGIYEPSFKDTSHGFRPRKGTHTAIKMIDQKCKGAN